MAALQTKGSGWLVHLTAWAVVLGMPLFVMGPDRPMMGGGDYLRALLVPLSFIVVFYVNFFVLIGRFVFKRRIGRFLLWNMVLIAAVMWCVGLLLHYVFLPEAPVRPAPIGWQHRVRFIINNTVLYMLVVGASVAIRMTGSWYRTEAARQQLEHAHTEAELQNLKSQLNPHFLFNTLNNIYSLIQIDTVRAQQAVHDLSRMLRYVLYDSSQPTVPLREEIRFLRDYIELMRLRLPRHVELEVSLPEEPSSAPIAPLLFISLVENAFKHGISNDKPSYVRIVIGEEDGRLECRIRNSSFPKDADSDRSGSGIGLQNLTKRLEMLYPDRHTFAYGPVGEHDYEATLTIELYEKR